MVDIPAVRPPLLVPETIRENDIEDYFIERIERAGGITRKVKWIGVDGAPDRIVFGVGWVELKRPGEKPRSRQIEEHHKMRAAGERVDVLSTFAEIDKYVNGIVF